MALNCIWLPEKGAKTFKELVKRVGRESAADIWNAMQSDRFNKEYGNSLVRDDEGVPTLDSILNHPLFVSFLGHKYAPALANGFPVLDSTIENINTLMKDVDEFNHDKESHKGWLAYVVQDGDKVKVQVISRNEKNAQIVACQQKIYQLNQKLGEILQPAGVTVGQLSKIESGLGRVGVTNFQHATQVAGEFRDLVKVANNLEGYAAISEEVAHLLIGVNKANPFMQRVISALMSNPVLMQAVLGDEYEKTVEYQNGDMSLVAEEAAGQLLRDALQNGGLNIDMPVFSRAIKAIKESFKGIDQNDIDKALNDVIYGINRFAEAAMEKPLTKDEIEAAKRMASFNALSEKIEAHIQALRQLEDNNFKYMTLTQNIERESTEQQTERATLYEHSKAIKSAIDNIKDDVDLLKGTIETARHINNEIRSLCRKAEHLDQLKPDDRFKILRNVFFGNQAMETIIDTLKSLMHSDELKEMMTADDVDDEAVKELRELMNSIQSAKTDLNNYVFTKGKKAFLEFLKPFVGEQVRIFNERTNQFQDINIENVMDDLQENGLFSRWLTSMADNSSSFMQILDKVISKTKTEKRLKVIEECKAIRALGFEADRLGINFEDFFEDDKAHYIMPVTRDDAGNDYSYDSAAYWKARNVKMAEIKAKHGNPSYGTDEYTAMIKEQRKWERMNLDIHIVNGKKVSVPSHALYPSKISSLSQEKQEWYGKWLSMKSAMEMRMDGAGMPTLSTIKISKTGAELLFEDGIKGVIDNVNEKLQKFKDHGFDTDDNHGNKANKTVDFYGNEVMKLTTNYQSCPRNKLHLLSTDMISTLQAYSEMSANYEAMLSVVNPMEVGKQVLLNSNTKIYDRQGAKEILKVGREKKVREMTINNAASALAGRLEDFIKSQIYRRYVEDNGNIGNTNVNTNEVASTVMKLGSACQLGFNALAWAANVATGASMQRIEAITGRFFKYKELTAADLEFIQEIPELVADSTRREKKSKISLMDELFNVRMDVDKEKRHAEWKRSNILAKIFGPNLQFFGQDAGDLWMYNRTAIAVLKHEKAEDAEGNEVSLWDIMKVQDGRIVFDEGYTYKGHTVSASNYEFINWIEDRMKYINHHLFGVYDEDSQIAARRNIALRFVMQYRDWLPAQLDYRYGKRQYNQQLHEETEGYYRTVGRLVKQIHDEMKNGEASIAQAWSNTKGSLDNWEKANIKRALTEISMYLIILALATLVRKSDPKDDTWATHFLRYMALREKTEHAILTPASGLGMFEEFNNIIKSPVAATSMFEKIGGIRKALWAPNWFEEVESGKFKGHSEGYKALAQSPVGLWTNTIMRTLDPKSASQQFK